MTSFEYQFIEAKGRERPDYTPFSFPAASLSDASTEEIELDQALSLQGRQGRDFLGAAVEGMLGLMETEHLTRTNADHQMDAIIQLNTRTGARGWAEPERLWGEIWRDAVVFNSTTAVGETLQPFIVSRETQLFAEPELYVASRLFWRFQNDLDVTVTADALNTRIASVAVRLTFFEFIELLERFADVTLL